MEWRQRDGERWGMLGILTTLAHTKTPGEVCFNSRGEIEARPASQWGGIQFDEPLLNFCLDASASGVDAFENPRPGGMKQLWTLLSETH